GYIPVIRIDCMDCEGGLMSFDELLNSDYTPKREEVIIKSGDKEYKFFANEISYLQRINLSSIQHVGGDSYTHLVMYSIADEDGKHMTLEQASKLPPEYAEKLFVAAAKVNNSKEDVKKKAK